MSSLFQNHDPYQPCRDILDFLSSFVIHQALHFWCVLQKGTEFLLMPSVFLGQSSTAGVEFDNLAYLQQQEWAMLNLSMRVLISLHGDVDPHLRSISNSNSITPLFRIPSLGLSHDDYR